METGDDYIVGEIEKTKRKLKEISSCLETQQQLLRLIVQVQELKSKKRIVANLIVYFCVENGN